LGRLLSSWLRSGRWVRNLLVSQETASGPNRECIRRAESKENTKRRGQQTIQRIDPAGRSK
jgi:hypothetical protein